MKASQNLKVTWQNVPTRTITAGGVEFAYREGAPVLHGIGVSLPAGISVAVVGETGSGKTTFAKLLCRPLLTLA